MSFDSLTIAGIAVAALVASFMLALVHADRDEGGVESPGSSCGR